MSGDWGVADVNGRVLLSIGNYAFEVVGREQDGAEGREALVELLARQVSTITPYPPSRGGAA